MQLSDFAAPPVDLVRILSISRRTKSSCMAFSFGQGLLNLAQNKGYRPTLPFEKSQAIPKTYDFLLSRRVHGALLAGMSAS